MNIVTSRTLFIGFAFLELLTEPKKRRSGEEGCGQFEIPQSLKCSSQLTLFCFLIEDDFPTLSIALNSNLLLLLSAMLSRSLVLLFVLLGTNS